MSDEGERLAAGSRSHCRGVSAAVYLLYHAYQYAPYPARRAAAAAALQNNGAVCLARAPAHLHRWRRAASGGAAHRRAAAVIHIAISHLLLSGAIAGAAWGSISLMLLLSEALKRQRRAGLFAATGGLQAGTSAQTASSREAPATCTSAFTAFYGGASAPARRQRIPAGRAFLQASADVRAAEKVEMSALQARAARAGKPVTRAGVSVVAGVDRVFSAPRG